MFPILVTYNVAHVLSTLSFVTSISFRYSQLITRWKSYLNSSSSCSRHNRLGCGMSCIVSFRSLDSTSHFFSSFSPKSFVLSLHSSIFFSRLVILYNVVKDTGIPDLAKIQ